MGHIIKPRCCPPGDVCLGVEACDICRIYEIGLWVADRTRGEADGTKVVFCWQVDGRILKSSIMPDHLAEFLTKSPELVINSARHN